MTAIVHSPSDQRALRNLRRIGIAALVAVAMAAGAGVILLVADPADGSTFEGVLGLTAAISGLSVGALAIAGAIYAQVKNLWRFVPGSIRAVVMTIVVIGVLLTVLNQLSELF